MRAAIFREPGVIAVEDRPKPVVVEPTDAVVRVVLACVCGSDLWLFRGLTPHGVGPIGHEFIGVVDEVGSDVAGLQVGDFVISPFTFSDGTCRTCRRGFHTACPHVGYFGRGRDGDGAQAEFVRVPLATGTLVKVPDGEHSERTMASLLTLSDVMPTGFHAASSAGVAAGQTVVVVGDGAVGLSGVLSCRMLGAERIILLASTHEDRHVLAREWGATDIVTVRGPAAVEAVLELTEGYGADAVLECVGTKEATETAFAVAGGGAVVGRVGVPHDAPIDAVRTFYRNVGTRGGVAPARAYIPDLLEAVLAGTIDPGRVFDLTTDLEHIADAYAAMDERRAIKALVQVSPL